DFIDWPRVAWQSRRLGGFHFPIPVSSIESQTGLYWTTLNSLVHESPWMNEPITATSPSTPTRPRGRRKRLWWTVLLAVLALVGWTLYYYLLADHGLAQAMAEANRLDPGWQLEDLEAARETVPDAENGAPIVLAAASLIPTPWPAWPTGNGGLDLEERLRALSPEVQLDNEQIEYVRTVLAQAKAALASARRLIDFPRGRYTVAVSPDYMSTPLPHL